MQGQGCRLLSSLLVCQSIRRSVCPAPVCHVCAVNSRQQPSVSGYFRFSAVPCRLYLYFGFSMPSYFSNLKLTKSTVLRAAGETRGGGGGSPPTVCRRYTLKGAISRDREKTGHNSSLKRTRLSAACRGVRISPTCAHKLRRHAVAARVAWRGKRGAACRLCSRS